MDSITSRFLESARLRRDKLALVAADGDALTYAQFDDRVLRHMRALENADIGSRDRVALLADDTVTFLAAFFACRQRGATVIPLATHHAPRELREIFEVTDPTAVMARSLHIEALRASPPSSTASSRAEETRRLDSSAAESLMSESQISESRISEALLSESLMNGREPLSLDDSGALDPAPTRWLSNGPLEGDASTERSDDPERENAAPTPTAFGSSPTNGGVTAIERALERTPVPDRVALGLSYDGSGRPIAVSLGEQQFLANLDAAQRINEGLVDERRPVLTLLEPHVVTNLFLGYLLPLCIGATVHHFNTRSHPSRIRGYIREQEVDTVFATPSAFCSLLREPVTEPEDFATLRAGIATGGHFPTVLLEKIHDRLGFTVCQTYGTTATLLLTSNHLDDPRFDTLGRALAGVELRILENGDEPPRGTTGDIVVRGPSIAESDPDTLDSRHALDDDFIPTGDRGYLDDDGFLHFVARTRPIAEVDGETVDLEEVRRVIAAHPSVDDVLVEARFDETRGQRIDAFVTSRTEPMDADALHAYCEREMSPHKIPQRFLSQHAATGTTPSPDDRRVGTARTRG